MNYTVKRLEDGTFNAEVGDDVEVWGGQTWITGQIFITALDDKKITVTWNQPGNVTADFIFSHVRHPVGGKGYLRLQNKMMTLFIQEVQANAIHVQSSPLDSDKSLDSKNYFTNILLKRVDFYIARLSTYEFDEPR